ncbi:hypothetical protein pb186bvf_011254 [Paramecium bursaria]
MNIQIRLFLVQLLMKSLLEIINQGTQEQKDHTTIALNAIISLIIFSVFSLEYARQSEKGINIFLLCVVVVNIEALMINVTDVGNYYRVIYIIGILVHIKTQSKNFKILTIITVLYAFGRLVGVINQQIGMHQLIFIIMIQPINIYLVTYQHKTEIKNDPYQFPQSTTHKQVPNHFSFAEPDPVIPSPRNDMQITEDILNCLPYGIILIDQNLQIIKQNDKSFNYLQTDNPNRTLDQLDELLLGAEINQMLKSPHIMKQRNKIMPLKNIQQRSAQQAKSSFANSVKHQIWVSDRSRNFNDSLKVLQTYGEQSQQLKYSRILYVIKEMAIKKQLNQSQTLNSEQTNIYKFIVQQDLSIKKRHLQIKVYELDNFSNQKQITYLWVIENKTNKEERINLQNRYNFQQALLNSFSHELRTPMNCTLSLLQAMQDKVTKEIQQNYLEPAIISGQRLLFQINDILDYAQIECKDFNLNLQTFKPESVLSQLKQLFELECKQKKIQLIVDYKENQALRNDKDRITQIMVNLLNNAIKFTKSGGRIVVAVMRKENQYIFSVWDNGKGISTEVVTELTVKNTVISQSNLEYNSNKLGIGLRVSQSIVKQLTLNGELQIQSQEGIYTKVSFAVENHQNSTSSLAEDLNQAQKVYTSSKIPEKCDCASILIVDDIPFNHIAIIALLEKYSIKIDSVYDGHQAIQKVQQKVSSTCCKTYKLIFMDIEMPGLNGFSTSSEVYIFLQSQIQQFLRTQQLESTIIMCSAYTGEQNSEQAIQAGMKEILPKPLTAHSIKSLIDKYVI